MARFGGRAALRAALGGVAGGLEGLGAMREQQRLAEEQRLARERQAMLDARQAAMDQTMLYDKGYLSADEATAARQQAGGGLGRVVSGATLGLLGPGAGAIAPAPSASDLALAKQAGAFALPQQTITLGGTRFQRPSPIAESMRQAEMTLAQQQTAERQKQAEAQRTQDVNVQAAMKAYNLTREQAQEYVRTGKSPFVEAQTPLTAYQKAQLAREDRRIRLAEETAARPGAATTATTPFPQDFSREIAKIQDFLPTTDAQGKLVAPKRVLSGVKSLAVQQGGPSGSLPGQITSLGATLAGADTSNEQLYNTIADGIATAYAIQEQRGRNVSDKDIANRISQIKLMPNEVGNLEVQSLKGQRLMQWADALMRGSVPEAKPGATMTPPRLESAGRFTDEDRARRWEELKAQNPNMPDEQITARVWREMP